MITVLQSFPSSAPQTNPYLTQLVGNLPEDVFSLGWSWRAALFSRYDVVHLHWPELLFRRANLVRSTAHQALFVILMLRIAASRIAIVRTVHNPTPHEPGGTLERWLLGWCARQTALWIGLNDSTELPAGRPSVVIPIGHYRDHYADAALGEQLPGRLLYFGLVRRYKGVLQLIDAFRNLSEPSATLRIVGQPNSADLRQAVESASRDDPRIVVELRYVEDDALARHISEAEMVVLPYAQMHNSGAVLLALSLDRPVLVPETPATIDLAEEVGRSWLITYRGELTAQILLNGLRRARVDERRGRPNLEARNWPRVAALHRAAYLAAVGRAESRAGTN
ncbi:MAG: GDP-mannose--glycolipid 4-beta-D-mannosyltransferase [Actinomycetota bacterium]|nr:GDP-mannose--glycolipid 4-beta-D-mannosyltransferase [Actinomycetota bacterium]